MSPWPNPNPEHRGGRRRLTVEERATRILALLAERGPMTSPKLQTFTGKRVPALYGRALDGLVAAGLVVVETRPAGNGRGEVVWVRLPAQQVPAGRPRRLVEALDGARVTWEDPDGTVPLWQRLDANTRMAVTYAIPVLRPAVREVVAAVLEQPVWSRASEGYALSWFLVAVTEGLEERGLLTFEVMRALFG